MALQFVTDRGIELSHEGYDPIYLKSQSDARFGQGFQIELLPGMSLSGEALTSPDGEETLEILTANADQLAGFLTEYHKQTLPTATDYDSDNPINLNDFEYIRTALAARTEEFDGSVGGVLDAVSLMSLHLAVRELQEAGSEVTFDPAALEAFNGQYEADMAAVSAILNRDDVGLSQLYADRVGVSVDPAPAVEDEAPEVAEVEPVTEPETVDTTPVASSLIITHEDNPTLTLAHGDRYRQLNHSDYGFGISLTDEADVERFDISNNSMNGRGFDTELGATTLETIQANSAEILEHLTAFYTDHIENMDRDPNDPVVVGDIDILRENIVGTIEDFDRTPGEVLDALSVVALYRALDAMPDEVDTAVIWGRNEQFSAEAREEYAPTQAADLELAYAILGHPEVDISTEAVLEPEPQPEPEPGPEVEEDDAEIAVVEPTPNPHPDIYEPDPEVVEVEEPDPEVVTPVTEPEVSEICTQLHNINFAEIVDGKGILNEADGAYTDLDFLNGMIDAAKELGLSENVYGHIEEALTDTTFLSTAASIQAIENVHTVLQHAQENGLDPVATEQAVVSAFFQSITTEDLVADTADIDDTAEYDPAALERARELVQEINTAFTAEQAVCPAPNAPDATAHFGGAHDGTTITSVLGDRPLSDDPREIQALATALGQDVGPIDGVIGTDTIAGLQALGIDPSTPNAEIVEALRDQIVANYTSEHLASLEGESAHVSQAVLRAFGIEDTQDGSDVSFDGVAGGETTRGLDTLYAHLNETQEPPEAVADLDATLPGVST